MHSRQFVRLARVTDVRIVWWLHGRGRFHNQLSLLLECMHFSIVPLHLRLAVSLRLDTIWPDVIQFTQILAAQFIRSPKAFDITTAD